MAARGIESQVDVSHDDIRAEIIQLLPDLRAYARFLVRQTAEADDLVQESLSRALAALSQFTPETNLRAWLFTILRNVFYEGARRRKTEQTVLSQASSDVSAAPAQPSHIDLSDLTRYLFTLPPLMREALVLVGAQGLSYEEAALVCAVPVGTVKARVSRARAQLAARMAPARSEGE